MRRALHALAAAAVAWLARPEVALACAVCFSATDENRKAFLLTTVFLSALPLVTVGGGAWWIVRRARALEAEDAAARAVAQIDSLRPM